MGKQSKAKQRSNQQGADKAVRDDDKHDRTPMKSGAPIIEENFK
ncbi:hypothetical protein [Bacillus taeanensis]|nr:hypothetical protein [Bacillus taeanensis]